MAGKFGQNPIQINYPVLQSEMRMNPFSRNN